MVYEILENVMGVYTGTYTKTFNELDDSVTYLLDYYDKIYTRLSAKRDFPTGDQRMDNMKTSAAGSARHTLGLLKILDNELRNPQHRDELEERFIKKRMDLLNKNKPQPTSTQTKLF